MNFKKSLPLITLSTESKDRSGRTGLDLAERYQAGDSRRVVTILQAATR